MEMMMIELLLWVGLVFFFWTLRNRLNQIETEIESIGVFATNQNMAAVGLRYDMPERVFDVIGSYMDAPIYRFAVFNGEQYQFDYIRPQALDDLQPEHRCIRPGLLYRPCGR